MGKFGYVDLMILDESELCFGDLAYETRLVAFFDILGWKNEIEEANSDPRHIARLATALRLFNANADAIGDAGARLTTFSDNVVFSKPYAAGDVRWLLEGLAVTQLGLASMGFWIRGGVTVGEIYHDEYIVFGPALNRAHHLESKVSEVPRIIVDEMIGLPDDTDFIDVGEPSFIDPFKAAFWDRVQRANEMQQSTLDRFHEMSGVEISSAPVILPGRFALSQIGNRLSAQLTSTSDLRAWNKLAWLFDRIMSDLNHTIRASDLPKSAGLPDAI